jgi:hypothetical protein
VLRVWLLDKAKPKCRLDLSSVNGLGQKFQRPRMRISFRTASAMNKELTVMQHKKPTPSRTHPWTIAVLCMGILFLMNIASVSQAQSGRRPPKQPTSPDPLPPKQDEPPIKPSPKDQNSTPGIPIKVGWYIQNMNTSSIYFRIVEDGCLDRLSQSNSVKASPTKELNRKQASDIAKGSTDTYVLWFELEVDYADNGRGGFGGVNPQYLSVRYEVFTPGTGKTKTSGHVYQRPRGPGGVPIPLPRTSGSAEYLLRNCGREMADRLLDALSVTRPPDRH